MGHVVQAARLAAEYAESARRKEEKLAEANSKTVLPTIGTFQRVERAHRPNAGQGAPVPQRTEPRTTSGLFCRTRMQW